MSEKPLLPNNHKDPVDHKDPKDSANQNKTQWSQTRMRIFSQTKAKINGNATSLSGIYVILRYIGYSLVVISQSMQLTQTNSQPNQEQYFANLVKIVGCPQLLGLFLAIETIFIPRLKSILQQHKQVNPSNKKKQKNQNNKNENEIQISVQGQNKQVQKKKKELQIQIQISIALEQSVEGACYKSAIYDKVIDVLLIIKVLLVFAATILITIDAVNFNNILTNAGILLSFISIIIQKILKWVQYYGKLEHMCLDKIDDIYQNLTKQEKNQINGNEKKPKQK